MSSFPSLPLFVREFLTDTTHLSLIEAGAYLHLLMHSWNRAKCSVPDDDKKLAAWCKLSPDEWVEIRPELEPFFSIKNGQWTQKRLLKEFNYVRDTINKRKQAGKKGGQAKALKTNKNSPSNATDLLKQKASKGLAPTPTPTPKVKEEGNPSKKKSTEAKLPKDWKPNEACRKYALERGLDIDRTTADFAEYWQNGRGRNEKRPGWDRTWQTWCRNAADRGQGTSKPNGGGNGQEPDSVIAAGRRVADELEAERSDQHKIRF